MAEFYGQRWRYFDWQIHSAFGFWHEYEEEYEESEEDGVGTVYRTGGASDSGSRISGYDFPENDV